LQQRTIAAKVSCSGTGLHTGVSVQITLRPARAGTGIVFVRRDGGRATEIPARPSSVSSTSHATTLTHSGVSVSTVEHLMAALHALGVDNLYVDVDGPEVPAMDGSAQPFVDLLRSSGLFVQPEPRAVLRIEQSVEVVDGNRSIRIDPAGSFQVSYAVDFEHPAIRRQELRIARVGAAVFERELSRARTFGFLDEVSALLKMGLAHGGSLENTVVLDSERVVNDDGLRWPDEFVRHKILDLVGDLALLGPAIRGHVKVERGGHALHQSLVQKILHTPDAWCLEGGGDEELTRGLDLKRAPQPSF
jgi:UDP-3-O-[3-hydroxymyristoyl] N-acetylglucosamine deacetylase